VLAIMAREAGSTLDAEAFEALVELMTKPHAAASHHAA
jgi:HD-GYP domain-containing protein (c-di-GMP phosphodiesterase class II)